NYTLTPYFHSPVAIYEIWIPGGSLRTQTKVDVTYPASWKVLSLWPDEAVSAPGHITIDYSGQHTQSDPVFLAFDTHGNGVLQQVGKYTVSGWNQEVQKLSAALSNLGFVDDLMQSSVGMTPPKNILIVGDNLTAVGELGYEADAIAAKPNTIIVN